MSAPPAKRKLRARLLQAAAVIGGLAVAYATVLWIWHARWPMKVVPAGCKSVHKDGLCELNDTRSLRLWVDSPADARIVVLQNRNKSPISEVKVPEGRLFRLAVAKGTTRITVIERRAARLRWATVPVSERQVPAGTWFAEAERVLYQEVRVEHAYRIVKAHINDDMSKHDKARTTRLLAEIELSRNALDAAKVRYRQAMAYEREAGLFSDEVNDALTLAMILGQYEHRYDEAERLIEEMREQIARVEDLNVWAVLQRALYQHMRGDLQKAYELVDEGDWWAARFRDDVAAAELGKLRAELLQQGGRTKEMLDAVDSIRSDELDACRRADLLHERGVLRLRVLETMESNSAPREYDPRRYLKEAIALRTSECNVALGRGNYLIDVARAELLYGQFEDAINHLEEVSRIEKPDADLLLELHEAQGQLRLTQRRWNEAADIFNHLRRQVEPNRFDAFETAWRANIGLARAYEGLEQFDDAIEAYARAEQYLDDRGWAMPLGADRTGFMRRHEQGTGQYIDLLVRLKKLGRAMSVMRHARLRALLVSGRQHEIARWTDEERHKWNEQYDMMRSAFVAAAEARVGETDEARRRELERIYQQSHADLLALATEKLKIGHLDAPLREVKPGEALLACHPAVDSRWLCIAQKNNDTFLAADDVRMGEKVTRDELARALAPLAPILLGASRLRVLTYGASRSVDFEALDISGQKLEDAVALSYSLDRARDANDRVRPAGGAIPRALVVVDARGASVANTLSAEWIEERLRNNWHTELLYETRDADSVRVKDEELRRSLATANRLFFLGHAEPSISHGVTMLRVGRSRLTTSDFIAAEQAPSSLILLGCSTGHEPGDDQSASLIELALVSGGATSWGVATRREVHSDVAAAMLRSLLEHGADRPDAEVDPIKMLREARRAARERLNASVAPAERERTNIELDAFGVFD